MKITIEIPDTTAAIFVGYVFHENSGASMAARMIDTGELQSEEVIICNPYGTTEKGGEQE